MPEEESKCYGRKPILPFYIDTEGYTGRDREMFVCGYELSLVVQEIREGFRGQRPMPIHTENGSRLRMLASRLGVKMSIRACDEGKEWSWLTVG